jgi:hypothetical protein
VNLFAERDIDVHVSLRRNISQKYSEKFDEWSPKSSKLSAPEIESIIAQVPE